MLAKKYRLPIQSFPLKVRTIRGSNFLVKFIPNYLKLNRGGVVISRRVHKLATKRNKLKRRILNIIKPFIMRETVNGRDVLIVVSPTAAQLSYQEIKAELTELLTKI